MANIQKSLATTKIRTGQFVDQIRRIQAWHFTSAFTEVDSKFDIAQTVVQVSDSDTHVKDLSSAIVAGNSATVTTLNPGGNEQLQIAIPNQPLNQGDGTGNAAVIINCGQLNAAAIEGDKAGSLRWRLQMPTSGLEDNPPYGGSLFSLFRYGDGGVSEPLATSIQMARNGRADIEDTWVNGGVSPQADFDHDGTAIGFFGATPVSKPTVSGSKGGNEALGELIGRLSFLGLITDSTT